MLIVKDRTRDTLYEMIQKFIHPDSIVFSDGWSSYRGMAEDLGYAGWEWVNHKKNFVRPEPYWVDVNAIHPSLIWTDFSGPAPEPNSVPVKVHTNTCERMWEDVKSYVKSCHSPEQVEYYLGESLKCCNKQLTNLYVSQLKLTLYLTGECMFRHNVLKDFLGNDGDKLLLVINNIKRRHPGPYEEELKWDVEMCYCKDCIN